MGGDLLEYKGDMLASRGIAPIILAGAAMAQTASGPQFDVASVKPAAPGGRGTFMTVIPGGLRMSNMTLKELIAVAYRIQSFQISGGPPWFDSAHFDVLAKSDAQPKRDDVPPMLQALLADRFELKLHRETREMPVLALVLARKDGKLGPALIESKEGSCSTADPTKGPLPPIQPGNPMPCGAMRRSPRQLTATRIAISQLITELSRFLGRTVIDKTGLTGNYDVTLDFTLDEAQLAAMLPPDAPRPPPPDGTGPPSIYVALQEQLGLKLETQKGPVEIFFIDHAEKPSEN
jgi:uncharacterized protein (TIGR03435 family)